jgi:hypothetical protein
VTRRLLAAALLVAASSALARDKTDVVVIRNGDVLTGEIKGMSRGKLDFNTDDAGRLSIKWDKILRISSVHAFDVELSSGGRHYGVLSSPSDQDLAVGLLPTPDVFPMDAVVEIVPMDDNFFGRVRAIFDFGFTFAKANSATTISTSGELAYRSRALGAKLNFDGYFQTQSDALNTTTVSQYTVALTGNYYFEQHWRAFVSGQLFHNDELSLILRSTVASGAGYSAVRNGWNELWLTAGLAGSREQYTTGDPNLTLEGLLSVSWTAFRYDTPKLDLATELVLLPGLSDWGRLRGTFTFRIKYEFFMDFNTGLQFTDTFDTRPPDVTASRNDYITSLTVGWSYRK